MRLNGWQRLWIVIAALWTPIALWQSVVALAPISAASLAAGIVVWTTPLAALYAAGLTVAWVRGGFDRATTPGA